MLGLEQKVEVTDRGLILKGPLEEAEWQALGLKLIRTERAHRWQIGDWWRAHRGDEVARVRFLQELDMDLKTVQNIASICAAYPLEDRFPELPMSYHEAVMALPRDERRRYLIRALEEGLTVSELRKMAQERLRAEKRVEAPRAEASWAPTPSRPKPDDVQPEETEEGGETVILAAPRIERSATDERDSQHAPFPKRREEVRVSPNGDGYEHARYPNVARVVFRNGRILLWNPSARMTADEARALAQVLEVAAEALEKEVMAEWR